MITDGAAQRDVQLLLPRIMKMVPRDVEIVLIAARLPKLPPAAGRRLRLRRVGPTSRVSDAVRHEVANAGTVILLRSDARLSSGWFEQVLAAAASLTGAIGELTPVDSAVVVYPADVTDVDHPVRVQLRGVEAVKPAHLRRPAEDLARSVTIGAVLIVKNEEDVLETCLSSVRPFVDEIIVYDTGSTDRTVEIARGCGATVVEGHWNNNFADARNRALQHSTAEWIFSIDADEVAEGDPVALRARLAREVCSVVSMLVVNTSWSGGDHGEAIRVNRLFRRKGTQWVGALHEQVRNADGGPLSSAIDVAPVRIVHSGYQSDRVAKQGKGDRNVSIARAAVDALPTEGTQDPLAWSNLGRSLVLADRFAEALDAFRIVRSKPVAPRINVQSARCAVDACFALGRKQEAIEWIEFAEQYGEPLGQTSLWRADVAMSENELGTARDLLDKIVPGVDLWGIEFDMEVVVMARAHLARLNDQPSEALAMLLELVQRRTDLVSLETLLDVASSAHITFSELAKSVPRGFVARSLREAMLIEPDLGHRWCVALWTTLHDNRAVVAGCIVAQRLPLSSALAWAVHAREAGIADQCPLRAISADEGRDPADRAIATAVLADALLEPASQAVLDARLAAVPKEALPMLHAAIRTFAPGVVDRLDSDDLAVPVPVLG